MGLGASYTLGKPCTLNLIASPRGGVIWNTASKPYITELYHQPWSGVIWNTAFRRRQKKNCKDQFLLPGDKTVGKEGMVQFPGLGTLCLCPWLLWILRRDRSHRTRSFIPSANVTERLLWPGLCHMGVHGMVSRGCRARRSCAGVVRGTGLHGRWNVRR